MSCEQKHKVTNKIFILLSEINFQKYIVRIITVEHEKRYNARISSEYNLTNSIWRRFQLLF